MNYFISKEEKSFVEQQFMVGTLTGKVNVYLSDNAFIYFIELIISQAANNSISLSFGDLTFDNPVFGKYKHLSELNGIRVNSSRMVSTDFLVNLANENPTKIYKTNAPNFDVGNFKHLVVKSGRLQNKTITSGVIETLENSMGDRTYEDFEKQYLGKLNTKPD